VLSLYREVNDLLFSTIIEGRTRDWSRFFATALLVSKTISGVARERAWDGEPFLTEASCKSIVPLEIEDREHHPQPQLPRCSALVGLREAGVEALAPGTEE
jgi:hypothetical protein